MKNPSLVRYAWLSIGAALATIFLKFGAFAITGSVGLLSDALEGIVNLVAAFVALMTLKVVEQPPDQTHEYGHDKAGYFSAGIEGTLIVVAAVIILLTSINRLFNPQPIEQGVIGLVVAGLAALINLGVGQILIRTGKEHRSITLEADGHHLMSDVWSSVGVIVGVGVAVISGVEWIDPLVAIAVGIKIGWEGVKILRRSMAGLMDTAMSREDRAILEDILNQYQDTEGIEWHGLRTRQSGARSFADVHVLTPPDWTVQHAHDLIETLEQDITGQLPGSTVNTHIEPQGDPAAMADAG
jgi:cation diffusion facilitator family transporter